MPRNKKFLDHTRWDWRNYAGVISNVLAQGNHLICWAIAFIRATEALFNIGRRLEQQRSFSIQHLVNNVPLGKFGLENTQTLGDFIQQNGLVDEAECSYRLVNETCVHVDPITETIDGVAIINTVDDVDLARLVVRHPVVGVLPLWDDLDYHRGGIYNPGSLEHGNLQYHAVLIVGFDVDDFGNYYWIIQNSWGRRWGVEGFGMIHRERIRGRRSLFTRVFYAEKNGYHRKKRSRRRFVC
ncbi:unnamed protein product [Arabidopsis halleri]